MEGISCTYHSWNNASSFDSTFSSSTFQKYSLKFKLHYHFHCVTVPKLEYPRYDVAPCMLSVDMTVEAVESGRQIVHTTPYVTSEKYRLVFPYVNSGISFGIFAITVNKSFRELLVFCRFEMSQPWAIFQFSLRLDGLSRNYSVYTFPSPWSEVFKSRWHIHSNLFKVTGFKIIVSH